jgi:hypothetical protein
LTPEFTAMSIDPWAVRNRDRLPENFAAELTSSIYPLLLGGGPEDSWLSVQLSLWREIDATVKKWIRVRPPDLLAWQSERWQANFLADVANAAMFVALAYGYDRSESDLKSRIDRTLRRAFRRRRLASRRSRRPTRLRNFLPAERA